MTNWLPYNDGESIGQPGSDGGTIIRDEEHALGARITLESGSPCHSITCGIYGSMVHTRFFDSEAQATTDFEAMKPRLVEILNALPFASDPHPDFGPSQEAIERFLVDFP